MNNKKRHKALGMKIFRLKKEMRDIYNKTKVKVKPGYIVESLDFGNGKTFMYFVFLDSWKKELCYVQISDGGSCGYNQVTAKTMYGTLVCKDGYNFVLSKYQEEGVSETVVKSFKEMVYEPKNYMCQYKRLCQWCGQGLIDCVAD